MDVLDFINRNGQRTVPNPNYNPRSKKNTELPTIIVPDAQPIPDDVIEIAKRDALNQFSIASVTADKYREFGLNYNPKENLDKQLADAQSNWSKATNAIGQTLVSELLIGIPKGFSDFFDSIGQAIGISDHNYSNPVSQFLEEKQEEFRQWAPIYTDPDKNVFNGGLTDAGWWFSNLPSIASSLTLYIPSIGITKGISYIGKLSKISKYTNKAARSVINPIMKATTGKGLTSYELGRNFEVGLSAAFSRTLENYQEARQTYNDNYIDASNALNAMSDKEYNNFLQRNSNYIKDTKVDTNDRDAVAKQIAKTAADRTFQLDWANIVFDVYQMYGLRNILSHAPKFTKSAATSAAQRNAIRTVGMKETEAAELLAKDSNLTKAKYWVKDNLFGFGRQIKSELSEGVEEAVNYIAQQEGNHLGKYLLTGEDGTPKDLDLFDSIGPMTSRILNDYYNDTGLWDSAFFGVLGGVVFQAGASKFNRLTQTIENRKKEKKSANKDDDTTKETKVTPHWWALDQSNETERMLTEINGRNHKLNTMRTQMQQINSGKNPYIKNEDGSNPDIGSPIEGRMLREKAYTEYLDELIITARNNGTLDMLEAYMEDKNVQDAVVAAYTTGDESNTISKEEAQEAATKALERIKKIDRLYQNEIIHASDIADKVGDKEGTPLPAEYIQMIASANVRHRLNLERYDEIAAMYNEDTERIKSVLGDRFDSTIDYKGLVSLRATIQELSSLIAQKKELEAKQKEKPTITRQYDIEELDQQINLIKRKALQTSTDAQFARSLYALTVANSAIKEYAPDGKSFKINASDIDLIENLDEFLMKDLSYIFDEVNQEKRTNVSNDAVIGELNKVMNDMIYVLPVNDNGELQNNDSYLQYLDPKLPDNYDILARIELEKIKENAKLAETENEIRHYIGAINNMENVARKAAINDAFETIKDIQKNHTDLELVDVINRIYENNNSDWLIDTNTLNNEERTKLDSALKILNLADVKNKTLFEELTTSLIYYKATQMQVDANDRQNTERTQVTSFDDVDNQTQNLDTFQNSDTGQQLSQPINQSQPTSYVVTEQENGQIEQMNEQISPKSITLSYNGSVINYAIPQNNNTDAKAIIDLKSLGNGNYELDFVNKGSEVKAEDISNNKLFDIRQQPMDGAIVKRNPIIRFGDNNEIQVISQGIVENPQISSTGEQNGFTANAQSYINRIESANTQDEVDAIYNEAINNGIQETELFPTYSRKQKEIADAKKVVEPETPVRGADPLDYIPKISGAAREFALRLKNGETITYENYLASLSDVKNSINDDTIFETKAKEAWNNSMQRLVKKYPDVVDNIINILQSSTSEEVSDTNFKRVFDKAFTSAVEKLVKAYLKDIHQKKINGKYIISLENLLRYCNGEFKNNENAEILYNVLANYLKSDEASNLYEVIETKEEISNSEFLNNVKTPLEERIDKAIKEESHRINTKDIKDKEIFDNLEEGQELTIRKTRDRIYFQFDGKDVGYIGIPKVVNGTYTSPYEFFLFEIRPNGKDKYYSKLADVFKSIVNAKDGDLKEIYDAALDRSISLKDNATWKAIKNDYAINTTDPETGEEYDQVDDILLDVIKTMASFSIKYGSTEKAIDGWFNALAQEYIAADNLNKNEDTKIIIDSINDGFIIRATDKLTDDGKNIIQSDVNKLPLASEAIGHNNKGKVSLAVGSRKQAGTVECVVKKENGKVTIPATYSFPGVGYSNSFVGIPISKGRVLFAQAYPITARELKAGSDAAKIVSAFSNKIVKYLENIANNPTNHQLFKELQDFLFEALNYKNSTTPLFHIDNCEKVNIGDNRGTHIGTNGRRGPRRDLRIFCNPGKTNIIQIQNENVSEKIAIIPENIDAIKKQIKQFLADTLQFNISENYIASDNNKRNQVEGLATRDKDGKFVVKIGNESWVFDSYNDFILNNDLVRINTKPNNYGNNVTRTSRNPNIRYKIVTSSPVERNEIAQLSTNSTTDIAKEANNIMSSSRTDKAASLARLIFDDDTVTTLTIYDLLPHNLVFDSNFNTGEGRELINASFNKTTKVTTIGPRFMSMLSSNNEAYRKQAIRKLIHERLHDILHSNNNEHYIQDIKNIYDSFVESLDNVENAKSILNNYLKKNKLNISLDNYYENFKKYKYLSKEDEIVRLEEFLVDTLTSVELANYLNSVTTLSKVNMRERKRDTLLNKIMRLLAKIMGINIKDNSLYAQEFEALRKAMNTTAELTLQFEEGSANEIEQSTDVEQSNDAEQSNEIEKPETKEKDNISGNKNNFNIINEETDDEEYSSTTEIYNEELLSELQEIKNAAIADGTFMKAPNGNPTNLTESQWLQVRTKEFKNWFGDWINNPNNSSKVVDENGEPLVTWHSTLNEIENNVFRNYEILTINKNEEWITNKNIQDYKKEGYVITDDDILEYYKGNNITIKRPNAIYSSSEKDVSNTYTKKEYEAFDAFDEYADWNADSKAEQWALEEDALYVEFKKEIEHNIPEEYKAYNIGFDAYKEYVIKETNKRVNEEMSKRHPEGKKEYITPTNPYNYSDSVLGSEFALFNSIKNPLIVDANYANWNEIEYNNEIHSTRSLEKYARDNGYDGIIVKNVYDVGEFSRVEGVVPSTIIASFNPNQVKSATNNTGAFSIKDDNIYNSDTIEEYETVASIGDYIQSYSPEDRAEIAREINNGNISIKCK